MSQILMEQLYLNKEYLKANPNSHCVILETAHPTKFLDVSRCY